MQHTNVQLVESVTFKAGGHHKTTSRTVAEQRRGLVGPGDSDIWDRVPVRVPPLPPSNLGGSCGIIQLQYALRFREGGSTSIVYDKTIKNLAY